MGHRFCRPAMVLALLALASCDDNGGTTPADGSVPDVARSDMMRVDGATDTGHVDGAPDGAPKLPAALLHTASGQALVVARDVLSSKAGDDVHLLNLGSPWSVVAGADAFGDDEAIVSGAALTADGTYLLAADNNGYSATAGNRVAVTQVLPGQLKAVQVLTSTTVIKDPTSIATSPFDNAAVVLGAMANQITVLNYAPGGNPPFSIRGPLATSSTPQLPVDTVMIRRGTLKGRVLVSENLSIRQIQFAASGQVTEVELFKVGSGNAAIVGAIGVQP